MVVPDIGLGSKNTSFAVPTGRNSELWRSLPRTFAYSCLSRQPSSCKAFGELGSRALPGNPQFLNVQHELLTYLSQPSQTLSQA